MDNQNNKIIALVGMPGCGKTEVARLFQLAHFEKLRFGDVTDEELKKRGMEVNEANERTVREDLRKQHGMDAYAKLILPKTKAALTRGNVILDGMRSFEEYTYLKQHFGSRLTVVTIFSSPETRYERLRKRPIRALTLDECKSRDLAEINNLNSAGPIAMADFTIVNEGSRVELERDIKDLIDNFGQR